MKRNNRWMIALPIVSALTLVACTAKPPATTKTDHATVEKIDANLKKVVLTSEAAKRLDIKTAEVRDEQVVRSRIVGGEIVALPASSVTTPNSAPVAPLPAIALSPILAADQFQTLLEERFDKNARGWPDKSTSTAWLDPDGLGYRMTGVTPGHFVAVGVPDQKNLSDVFISATFRKTAGPAGGGYGLIVRDQQPGGRNGIDESGNYYLFEANDRGEWGVWQRDGNRWIEHSAWSTSNAVRTGGADNQLAVAAVGDSMTFVINGTPVTTLTDSALKTGGVGIFAAGDGDHFLVDRVSVRAPKSVSAPAAPVESTRLVVRVPLSASEQSQIMRGQAGQVLPLIPRATVSGTPAQPAEVAGDGGLFYALDAGAQYATGERVRVEVPLVGGGVQRKVVPYSSVIYDLKGDAWTYTSPAPLTFVRDRINIDFIDGDKAVLSQGPASGTAVVTTGAAELFGTEAGVGH